jgi:hypothetical protein
MNKTVLSEIKNAKKVYPLVLNEIRKFGLRMERHIDPFFDPFFVNDKGPSDKFLLKKLHKITGKDIAVIDSYIEGWESDPFWREADVQDYSINISLPEPKIIDNITQEEISEIHEIVKSENYKNFTKDLFERKFFREFNDYFQKLLEINLQYLLDNV